MRSRIQEVITGCRDHDCEPDLELSDDPWARRSAGAGSRSAGDPDRTKMPACAERPAGLAAVEAMILNQQERREQADERCQRDEQVPIDETEFQDVAGEDPSQDCEERIGDQP